MNTDAVVKHWDSMQPLETHELELHITTYYKC